MKKFPIFLTFWFLSEKFPIFFIVWFVSEKVSNRFPLFGLCNLFCFQRFSKRKLCNLLFPFCFQSISKGGNFPNAIFSLLGLWGWGMSYAGSVAAAMPCCASAFKNDECACTSSLVASVFFCLPGASVI